ncbi:EmrB/QacA subfamily drug resistance transporter [Actinoplanes campanulatus]|uniref:EmrB/QacA subfamily drug resistance transporter n=1 Tax=Actinoplanes campanulatus TaxID=113559 RepID=A0A7W5FFW8_9ACTN|nr:DHA2 family efflux MFS transporter permease subunit [Actinoplanes campanulatus]MBB3096822.1 EmrB/QacA subfamily drug resistance transporter [Actinoplanes campanulatus]GGN44383.1 MFS transporter [Actinoplanes campanulatus]GID37366.1 MFS transporter [Actinoplanes campanulatus]
MAATVFARRWYALIALALCTLAIGLDSTVLSVALPTLAQDLGATTADLQWFTTSYLLVLAAALLPAGMLGDRYGRKRLLLIALVLFGAASVACAYAQTTGQLIAARAALGLGSAVIMALMGAVLTVLFDEDERPRALSLWVTANALGVPLGPLLGGWLLDNFRWGSVFLINLPLVALGLVAVATLVPESHGDRRRRPDWLGVLLSASGLVALTYGIIEAGERGWSDPRALVTIAFGVFALGALVFWERRAAAPLIDLELFRNRAFTGGTILATLAGFAFFGLLFALPQMFQAVGGHDALGVGLRLLPIIGGLLVGARIADRLAARIGARALIAAGLAVIAAALATGAVLGYTLFGAWITATGVGLGLSMPPAMNAALGALTPERSGVGNAMVQSLRQVGSAIGVAVLGMAMNTTYRDALPATAPDEVRDSAAAGVAVAGRLGDPALLGAVRDAFIDGTAVALLVAAGVAAVGVALALVLLPARIAPSKALAESAV